MIRRQSQGEDGHLVVRHDDFNIPKRPRKAGNSLEGSALRDHGGSVLVKITLATKYETKVELRVGNGCVGSRRLTCAIPTARFRPKRGLARLAIDRASTSEVEVGAVSYPINLTRQRECCPNRVILLPC
jgi:hypothetical protein